MRIWLTDADEIKASGILSWFHLEKVKNHILFKYQI